MIPLLAERASARCGRRAKRLERTYYARVKY